MADIERGYCHVCSHKWIRDQHPGLECPSCHSDFVEVIERGQDPREDAAEDDDSEYNTDRARGLRSHLLTRSPWDNAPDPDEGDIPHLSRPPILSSTIYRSSTPIGLAGQQVNDPLFAPFYQSFSTIMDTGAGGRPGGGRNRQNGGIRSPARSPDLGSMPPLPHTYGHNHRPWNAPGSGPGFPLREGGPPFGGGRAQFTATARVWPREGVNNLPQQAPIDNLSGLLGTLLQSINGMNQMGQNGQGINTAIPPIHLFAHLLNPDNATHGDAVYTEEALDRVITQFMEQTHGSSAPGPASAEAISGLPKKEADKSMMGSDGKAECSVCMDNVDIGDEVTVLPCGHWFHGNCVGAWLKEHDTCPHCRQGIMPKDVDGLPSNSPRSPGQPPRNNNQPPQSPGAESGRGLLFTVQPPSQRSGVRPPEPQSRQDYHRRRPSAREGRNGGEGSSGGGGGGGFSAWVRDRWRGSSDRS
ncbi:hypothetical protein MMC07_005092 [Pseudocyphellaria aurata]|nr:hypothetical protein [Pseudocyphellaria aurata]